MKISCSWSSNLNTSLSLQASDSSLSSKVSDKGNFLSLILFTMINCQMKLFPGKQKAARSTLTAPTSPSPLVSEWWCAVQVLAVRFALLSLAAGDYSHNFCFAVEHYSTECTQTSHHLPLTNEGIILPYTGSRGFSILNQRIFSMLK